MTYYYDFSTFALPSWIFRFLPTNEYFSWGYPVDFRMFRLILICVWTYKWYIVDKLLVINTTVVVVLVETVAVYGTWQKATYSGLTEVITLRNAVMHSKSAVSSLATHRRHCKTVENIIQFEQLTAFLLLIQLYIPAQTPLCSSAPVIPTKPVCPMVRWVRLSALSLGSQEPDTTAANEWWQGGGQ